MSGLFPHHVIEAKPGFVFIVGPADDEDEAAIESAQAVQNYLTENWKDAACGLTVDEARDPEEADLIMTDVMQLLTDGGFEEANQFVITSILVVGQTVITNILLVGEELLDDEGDEAGDEDDDSLAADEEDFE